MKPANILLSDKGHDNTLYLVDFGLAKKVKGLTGNSFLDSNEYFAGTPLYASIGSSQNRPTCFADDLESWFYCVVMILTGTLPWQLDDDDSEETENIYETHEQTVAAKKRTSDF